MEQALLLWFGLYNVLIPSGSMWWLPSPVWTYQRWPAVQGHQQHDLLLRQSQSSWCQLEICVVTTGCDDWVRGWGWRWLQDHRRKQRKAFAGENSKICFINLENVTLHWNILFINLENVTLQGPLDTDILREYIKARSPLNYKWGPDIYIIN